MKLPSGKFVRLAIAVLILVVLGAIIAIAGAGPILWAVLAIFVAAAIFGFFYMKRKKAGPKEEPVAQAPQILRRDPVSEFTGKDSIAHLFLDIFKLQLGASSEDEARFEMVESSSRGSRARYELWVQVGDKSQSRVMTVGELGEPGTSKSQCYHVIYDDQLVVKVPPKAIASFSAYERSIARDKGIVDALAPRECLVPSVMVILDKLVSGSKETPFTDEESGVAWLSSSEEYQQYFKIGDSFVYFMDLARFFFLSRVHDEIHNLDRLVYKAMLQDQDVIPEPYKFEERHGDENLGYALRDIYFQFEEVARELLSRESTQSSASVQSYKFRYWFFHFLGGRKVGKGEKGFSKEFLSGLNRVLSRLAKENTDTIRTYRNLVQGSIQKVTFSRNRGQITSISSNMLELMGWLNKKQVAIRDLKPDNLLLIGDPDKFPKFLNYAGEFKIGLIDVETAVNLSAADGEKLSQPMLAGTQLYATPLHFVPNALIEKIFDDTALILHLQDWYASIGMIFHVITGGALFESTAGVFPNILKSFKKAMTGGTLSEAAVRKANEIFWKSASMELEQKLSVSRPILSKVQIPIHDNVKPALEQIGSKTIGSVLEETKKVVLGQKLFTDKKIQKRLYSASGPEISAIAKKWMAQKGPSLSQDSKNMAIVLFRKLLLLKKQELNQRGLQETILASSSKIPADSLLQALFDITLVLMYQKKWGVMVPPKPAGGKLPGKKPEGAGQTLAL